MSNKHVSVYTQSESSSFFLSLSLSNCLSFVDYSLLSLILFFHFCTPRNEWEICLIKKAPSTAGSQHHLGVKKDYEQQRSFLNTFDCWAHVARKQSESAIYDKEYCPGDWCTMHGNLMTIHRRQWRAILEEVNNSALRHWCIATVFILIPWFPPAVAWHSCRRSESKGVWFIKSAGLCFHF